MAAKLDVAQVSDITKVISADTFERPIYAGNAIATVQSGDSIKVITVRGTGFDAVSAEGGSASVESIDVVKDAGVSKFVSEELAKSDRPELTAAKIVISGGRGMQNGDNFEMLYKVADKLGAAVGASRAAVDAGFVPNDMQVGHVFGQLVAVGGVVGQQDLAHAFYFGSFVSDSGTAFTGNQHGDVAADGLGGSNDVQGDPFQSGIVMFCVD